MAPRKRKVVSVTKKKKVVEETVTLTVSDGGDPNVVTVSENDQETQDFTFSLPVEENVEIPVEVRNEESPPPPETPAPTSEGTVKKTEIPVEFRHEESPQPLETPTTTGEATVKKTEIPVETRHEESPQPLETPATTGEGTAKKTNKENKKKKKRNKKRDDMVGDEYGRYVYKVMKQVHPDLGITSKAMTVVNMFMGDMFERITKEAAKLSDYTNRKTLSAREIEAAVRLVLPGELSRHAIAEGSKAVSNYVGYNSKKR